MKQISTTQRNILGVLESTDLRNIIAESMRILNLCYKLDQTLKSDFNGDIDTKEDEELDLLDNICALPAPIALESMKLNSCCRDFGTQYRCIEFSNSFIGISCLAKTYSEAYVPLTVDERKKLICTLESLLGQGSNFLYYQFDVDKYSDDIRENKEPRVNIELAMYCRDNQIKFPKLVLYLTKLKEMYKVILPIFTEYPELEEPFIRVVGPLYPDFCKYEKIINAQDIIDIVNDTITPEELLTQLALKCENSPELLTDVES